MTQKETDVISRVACAIYLSMFPERVVGDWVIEEKRLRDCYLATARDAIVAMRPERDALLAKIESMKQALLLVESVACDSDCPREAVFLPDGQNCKSGGITWTPTN